MKKRAMIFGRTGQMGSYLADFLTDHGYTVFSPLKNSYDFLLITVAEQLRSLLQEDRPDEIYNMAGLNFAADSWYYPEKYMKVNGTIVLTLLEAIKKYSPRTKFFQASSAEIFDKKLVLQSEGSPRVPENPYGLAKNFATDIVQIYREKYRLFACSGIFFNAESPNRSKFFFAEKVAHEVVRIKKALLEGKEPLKIQLGRLSARRDWGWAPEYVEVAWKMMQLYSPQDFVIGTGESHTCLEFVQEAFVAAGFSKEDVNRYVVYEEDNNLGLIDSMRAIPTRAEKILGWKAKYKFKDVVKMLVEAEMKVQLGVMVE